MELNLGVGGTGTVTFTVWIRLHRSHAQPGDRDLPSHSGWGGDCGVRVDCHRDLSALRDGPGVAETRTCTRTTTTE